jgi:hypothetical protein
MTQDIIRYGPLGGYALNPDQVASLFKEGNVRQSIDEPLILSSLNGRKEQWPKTIDYISYEIELYRQWAYRHANGDKLLLHEIDSFIRDFFEWIKQGREKGQLDDIEQRRLTALKASLTEKLRGYVPERLISGGEASIKQLLDDIENSEHIKRYPPGPSDTWYDSEIIRLSLLSEKIDLLMKVVRKIHPENANKYQYLYYLDKVTGDIGDYVGTLKGSRDELYDRIGKEKIDLEKHLSKIDKDIDRTSRNIKRHFDELKERLVASEPLEISEIVIAFQQYLKSNDISKLPPIRQLYYTLRKHKEPCPEDTSKLADFIIALGRAIHHKAGYQELLHELSSEEVLREIENLDTSKYQPVNETLLNNSYMSEDKNEPKEKAAQGNGAENRKRGAQKRTQLKDELIRDQVFICYSHKDKKLLDELQIHLKPYIRNRSITAWSDKKIESGSKWFPEIKMALARTRVAVLLVTPNLIASDFIHEHELKPLLKEAEKGEVQIIWIPVRACSYKETMLKDYHAAIDPEKPLASMKTERDKAWITICEEIKKAVNR